MAADGDWPTYGRDLAGTRFSPLKQITPANVNQLSRAWTYHMKPAAVSGGGRVWEVSPVVVDGVMYLTTAYNHVVALDPQTGTELWSYEVKGGQPAQRGLEYWSGDKQLPAQVFFGTSDGDTTSLSTLLTGPPAWASAR